MDKGKKKIIAILYGGRSGEHEVSLSSGASVARNLDPRRYEVLLVGITRGGTWFLQDPEELRRCRAGAPGLSIAEEPRLRLSVAPGGGPSGALIRADGGAVPVDIVFPVLHGTYGEDGTVQGLLELADLPYAGAGVLGSALGMDKDRAKALWARAGLPVLPWICIRRSDWRADSAAALVARAERDFGFPVFVKPSCAGSSVGAAKAKDAAGFRAAVDEAFRWDDKVLVEPFVPARELECSVTGDDEIEAWPPGEIVPSHEFYDYDAKYIDPEGAALVVPAQLDETTAAKIRRIAETAYREAELSGFARVDCFIRKDNGEVVLNEVNTIPGFTPISMFSRMCEAGGLPYGELLDRIVAMAEKRHRIRADRDYRRDRPAGA